MSVRQVQPATSAATARDVVFAFRLEDYSGRVRVYTVVDGRVFDTREVEVREGEPVQVRMQVPANAKVVRMVVADEEDNILLDKTVALPPSTGREGWVALTPGLERWFGVGAQEGEVASGLQVPPELLQQLQQVLQEQQQLEQQVQQVKQAVVQESQE